MDAASSGPNLWTLSVIGGPILLGLIMALIVWRRSGTSRGPDVRPSDMPAPRADPTAEVPSEPPAEPSRSGRR